jgi:hypothetical protein
MSRFWGRIMKMVPPFNGTKEQAEKNFMTHKWKTVDLEQRFGMTGLGKVVECSVCGVLSDTNSANWPCGEAPEPIEFSRIADSYKKR